MHIDRKWYKTYLWAVGSAFAAGVVLYCFTGPVVHKFFTSLMNSGTDIQNHPMWWATLLSGWVLAGFTGGALLFALWVALRSTTLKILCAVFCPITVLIITVAGIFAIFPMAALCITRLQKRKFKKAPRLPGRAQHRGKKASCGYIPEGCAPPQNRAGQRYSTHVSTPPASPANNKP